MIGATLTAVDVAPVPPRSVAPFPASLGADPERHPPASPAPVQIPVRTASISVAPEPDRNVLTLTGDVDRTTVERFHSVHRLLARDPRPTVVDCSRVGFIDSAGLRMLLELLDRRPQDRLANLPGHAARLFRAVGRHDVLRDRARHAVAVATFADVDVVTAARISEVFLLANREGCTYDLVGLPVEPTTCIAPPIERQWHYVVVPPLDSWLGLSAAGPLVRWLRGLVASSDRVLGVGTGLFALAAAGCLDHHRVAGWSRQRSLVAAAPLATVGSTASVTDGRLETASDADAAVELCAAAVGRDYGDGVRHLVEMRVARPGGAHARRATPLPAS